MTRNVCGKPKHIFYRPRLRRKRRGRRGLLRQGEFMSCAGMRKRATLRLCPAWSPPAERWRGSPPGAEHAQSTRGKFPLSVFAAQRRAGGMPYPVPAGRVNIAAAQVFALADERRFACPVRRNIALCLRQHRSGAGPAKAAAPEFKPLVRGWRQMRQEPQRALPSGAAFSASMFDHEKKGEDRTSSPLVVMTDYRTLKS